MHDTRDHVHHEPKGTLWVFFGALSASAVVMLFIVYEVFDKVVAPVLDWLVNL